MIGCKTNTLNTSLISDILRQQCINELRETLHTQSKWLKVHAAEYLLWSGNAEGVQKVFQEEQQRFGTEAPYRIGIWRVLAQATDNTDEKKIWAGKILKAFLDTNGTDRVHAAETLAKLGMSPLKEAPEVTSHALNSTDTSLSLYTRWSVSFSSEDSLKAAGAAFFNLLVSEGVDSSIKKLAAYVVRHFGGLTKDNWCLLTKKALLESTGSQAGISMLSTAFVTAPVNSVQSSSFQKIRKGLLKYYDSPDKADRIEMAAALSEKGSKDDLPVLISLLNNEKPVGNGIDQVDVQASSAYAILKIGKHKDNL